MSLPEWHPLLAAATYRQFWTGLYMYDPEQHPAIRVQLLDPHAHAKSEESLHKGAWHVLLLPEGSIKVMTAEALERSAPDLRHRLTFLWVATELAEYSHKGWSTDVGEITLAEVVHNDWWTSTQNTRRPDAGTEAGVVLEGNRLALARAYRLHSTLRLVAPEVAE